MEKETLKMLKSINKHSDMVNKKKTKRVLKPWVKITLLLIIGAVIGIAIYQLFTVKKTYSTPVGDYICKGGLIQSCNGSKKSHELFRNLSND